MKTRLLSAILTAAILLTMLSCHAPEINPGKTDTAAVTERITDTETTAPLVTEPMTAAAETEPITQAPTPETTAAPETETETPVDTEAPPKEPVLDIANLPPDIPAPILFAGVIQRPMMYKAIGTSSTFYCTGITGTPYSPNIPYQSEEYNSLVKGWYTFSPDSDVPMKPLETTEHTVSLTLGEKTLTASYSTYQIGNKHYTVRPTPYTQGASGPYELIDGSLGAQYENGIPIPTNALSVFLTDARYIYCTLVTNSVEDIVIYDTVTKTWASLRERAVPTAERYETLRKHDIHSGMDTQAILLWAQIQVVSPNNDRFLYSVSDNNDPQSHGGTYFVYDLNTGRSTLVCNDSWEGSLISGDTEYFGWLDNDTIYIVPDVPSKQGEVYSPCYLIRYREGSWHSEIITNRVWLDGTINIGADVYLAESVNGEKQYYHAETGTAVSDALNTLLTAYDSFYLALGMEPHMLMHDGLVYQNNHGGHFTIYDTRSDQLYRMIDTALTYEGSVFIKNMFLTPNGILLNLETQAERNCYIYYLPYAYLEYLRS